MQDQLLTKCPHCGTTFRLSKEHLEIAGGAVRCGSCYQVFHAKEHIVKTAVIEEVRQETPPQEEAPDPFEEFELDDGDPYEEAPNWSAEDHPDADLFAEAYTGDEEDPTLKEFGIDPTPEPEPENKTKKTDGVDESWAEALLEEIGEDVDDAEQGLIQDNPEEDNDYESNTGFGGITSAGSAFPDELDTPSPQDEISESFRELHYENFNKFGIDDDDDDTSAKSTDESWAQKMLEELEAEEAPKAPSLEELSILEDTSEEPQQNNPFAAKELSRSAEDAIAQAREKAREEAKRRREAEKNKPQKAAADEQQPTEQQQEDTFFGDINGTFDLEDEIDLSEMGGMIADEHTTPPRQQTEPETESEQDILEQQLAVSELHFGEEPHKKRSGLKTFALIFFNVVALLGLAVQHAYFNFAELARQEAYRPYYKMACEQLGCQLPTRVDVERIQGANLVVRTHPAEPNALVIDAIVYNRANYPQPYPDLKLSFEDINGRPVASRRFKPTEYIQDKSIDFQNMPPNTPVHLTLEIVDPGKKAVNYQIDFLAQTAP